MPTTCDTSAVAGSVHRGHHSKRRVALSRTKLKTISLISLCGATTPFLTVGYPITKRRMMHHITSPSPKSKIYPNWPSPSPSASEKLVSILKPSFRDNKRQTKGLFT